MQLVEMINNFTNDFIQDEEGVTAIEYGLIAALIAVVIIASVQLLGTNLSALFAAIASAISGAMPGGAAG